MLSTLSLSKNIILRTLFDKVQYSLSTFIDPEMSSRLVKCQKVILNVILMHYMIKLKHSETLCKLKTTSLIFFAMEEDLKYFQMEYDLIFFNGRQPQLSLQKQGPQFC